MGRESIDSPVQIVPKVFSKNVISYIPTFGTFLKIHQ
jgi:hypothetical protein